MGWFTKRHRAPPSEIAQYLYKIIVTEGTYGDMNNDKLFSLTNAKSPELLEVIKIYREAAVLFVLLAQKRKGFDSVLRSFEELIFPADEARSEKMGQLEPAMNDFAQLVQSDSPRLSWAHEWLASAGQTEENPISLTLVCTHWMSVISGVADALDQLKPG